jgi:beta-phosphoglucomutase-like phosphatase (HAD superfamily)
VKGLEMDVAKIEVKNKILLLDFDGTLVDTEKLAIRVIEEYCLGKNLFSQVQSLKNISQSIVGRTWKSAISEMLRLHPLGIDPAELERDLKLLYRNMLVSGVEWIPGVQEKLKELKAASLAMGIVTGSSRDEVELIIDAEGNSHLFDFIWSAENYSESKPSPEPFVTALEKVKKEHLAVEGLQILPHDILVFEDSHAGMESAHRAGMPFVQILHSHPEMLPDPRALATVRDWRELRFG